MEGKLYYNVFFGSLAKLLRSFAKKYCVPLRIFFAAEVLNQSELRANWDTFEMTGENVIHPCSFSPTFCFHHKSYFTKTQFLNGTQNVFRENATLFFHSPSPCPSIQQDRTCQDSLDKVNIGCVQNFSGHFMSIKCQWNMVSHISIIHINL